MTLSLSRPLRRALLVCLIVLVTLALAAINAPALHLLGSQPIRMFPASGPHTETKPDVAVVFFSGDMGFNFGMSGPIAAAVAAKGLPVVGISSPVVFASHRTRAQTEAIVIGAIRLALTHTGAGHIVLMGQSYGADILATTAPDLPPDLRARVLAIDLTVPGENVYFRADPSTLGYLGTPDAKPAQGLRSVRWAPVICVYGRDEADSLCPSLSGAAARIVGLPGNHHLNHDRARVIATTLAALHDLAPRTGL